ncbi:hypothetical protein COU00_00150 [Candidatus Falkowbacteria bacterium CG10_big_fil_rev_8_21_14_0_10_43_11]|uniref:DUF192 domain-containing protein n=1 Tax=Candidatus Falkowbacteria bacterium CG10_big_fil_rev_8_21_14_0_10_43_11 TaxID=1974568 RepID=A0A2M6WN44_9BACT|nr:MAG: hypothetical protein COU00_00150 [Candidatus Falkowbacteria bacterium CG10_big_fil_rev_8_21_14_0_10_43_11]
MRLSIPLLISFSLIITGCGFNAPPIVKGVKLPLPNGVKSVCFENGCFEVELAVAPTERALGLMYREKLPKNRGMLFIFPAEGLYDFWMKNTLIPLDIIWLDKDKRVVYANKNTAPCGQELCPTIKPDRQAQFVLEINAGLADRMGLKIGDYLNFFQN